MTLQIKRIVLYGHDGEIRELALLPGRVNVITGASKTGKSALIHIIEYCLGAGELTVPAGVIRNSVAWYGLLLDFGSSQAFVAREAPSALRRSNENVYFATADEVTVPSLPELHQTVNTEGLVEYLTRRVGISPNIHTPDEGETRRPLEANLRHALFFNFQAQDEIASPRILFHKQGEQWIPQSIRDTLPYFLGAVEEDRLAKQQELRRVRADLRRAERDLVEQQELRGYSGERAAALVLEAQQVGLLAPGERAEPAVERLAVAMINSGHSPDEEGPATTEAVSRLEKERIELNRELRRQVDELESIRTFEREQGGFQAEVAEQQARLQSLHYYSAEDGDAGKCPVCLSSLQDPAPDARALAQSLGRLSRQLQSVASERPRTIEFVDRIERTIADLRVRLGANREALESLRRQRAESRGAEESAATRNHVAGRISLYLETVTALEGIQGLQDQIVRLQSSVKELEAELRDDMGEEVLTSILSIISEQVTAWARELNLEHSQFPLRLDLKKLTVVADTDRGPVPMDRMGSGENWVGYHLITLLALHQWFVQRNRPVPNFLVLDQPTQVYYPPDKDAEGSLEMLRDEDRDAVRRMFRLIFDVVEKLAPKLQVIIMDHADLRDDWFQGAVVERWRGGAKLIPSTW